MARREEIANRMATAVLKRLTFKKYLEVRDDAAAQAAIRRIIIENLQAEDRLDADARKLLLDHARAIKDSSADYRHLLGKVKEKLARDRGFVL